MPEPPRLVLFDVEEGQSPFREGSFLLLVSVISFFWSLPKAFSRDEELVVRGEDEICTPTEGDPFRRRSKSAPPALWAAKKYGQQLRRMSDEFDSLLDKGMKKAKNAGTTRKMHHSKTWWSYLFSHQESDGENSHHENHTQRTE
uniref:BCL2 associated agonist of cell death b n=1 Tax=Amphilophus citrinellus TaxID=61819 RepID=A0A3Q0QNR1_AMPCI